ncbi:C-C motif chemokine 3-like isoform X2 [Spea bombifrons]|uniref:C-C motif chemokine 3-like isoform X2 n=1 Tax=Spea bombifrons TaxID=233779 RepID=UPI0023494F35|nr:C-C motif chemokine 3-like isoform X2 [Spea bombifrons]
MKVSLLALSVVILMCSACIYSSPHTPTSCCFSYSNKVPSKRIASYFNTSTLCSKPAVVFLTFKNKPICANPQEKWVTKTIRHLNKRSLQLPA